MAKRIATIDAYIGNLPEGMQPVVEALRKAIRKAAPGSTEAIKYGMPAFMMAGTYVVYLAAWKKHIGLYPVARGTAAFEKKIAPYRAKKDTVQFPLGEPVPFALVKTIVSTRVKKIRWPHGG